MEGTVKFFNRKKGFGFIAGDDGKEYFVHFTGLSQGTFLRDNDKVAFEGVEGDRGLKAQNVILLQKASDRTDLPAEGEMDSAPMEEEPAQEAQEEEPASESQESQDEPADEEPAGEEQPAEESSEESDESQEETSSEESEEKKEE